MPPEVALVPTTTPFEEVAKTGLFRLEWLRWFNSLRLRANATLTSPFSLGGSDTDSVAMGAPPAYLPVLNAHYFLATSDLDAVVRGWYWASTAGVSVRGRLFDLTSAVAAGTSAWVLATARPTNPVEFDVSLLAGHLYRLEIISNTASEPGYGIGDLYAT